jgi:hypothetical protein
MAVLIYAAGHHHGIRGASKVDTSTPDGVVESNAKTVVDAATVELKPVEQTVDVADSGTDEIVENSPSNEALYAAASVEDAAIESVKEKAVAAPAGPQSLFSTAKIDKICGRELPFDLLDHNSWTTPYTPSYFENEPTDSTDAVFVNGLYPYGNTLIIGLFHAIDVAYDLKCEIYIAKDCTWIWDVMTPWFYGENYTRDDAFYKTMEGVLGVHIVQTDDEIGKTGIHRLNSNGAFYGRGRTLTAEQIRNRRDTIFRNLFALPNPPCDNIIAGGLDKADAKYTVIDVPWENGWNARVSEFTGRDHTEAFEMKPEYVKSILEPLNMLDYPIYLAKSDVDEDPNRDEVKRLEEDSELKTDEKDVMNDLHLAVLADVFIGDPCSHWSLMIARMRYALGIKNSFVFTEKKDGKWVSFVDDGNYLELYNITSPWFG